MKIFILLMVIALINSCNDTPTETTQKTEIIPLSVGNIWIYQNSELDTNGQIINQYYDTLRVVKDTIIDGTRWFTYYNSSGDLWFQNTNNGYRKWFGFYDLNNLEYKYPGNEGEVFVSDLQGAKQIDSIDAIYRTKIGSFKCYKYSDMMDYVGDVEEYVAPGIGLICRLSYYFNGTGKDYNVAYSHELIFYEVK